MVTRAGIDPGRGLGWGTFLSGFVPGLLQFRLGQQNRGLLALVSCTALYFVGWVLVRERLFYWALLDAGTPGGRLAALRVAAQFGFATPLPELLNLPASLLGALLSFDGSPTGERAWRDIQPSEYLGGFLTGASGMLAAFWAAAGHWELRRRRDGGTTPPVPVADPALCAALSWLVPGLGHARAGQKDKGLVLGAAVAIVFAMGLLFSHGHGCDRATYSVWWMAQNLFGGGTLFAALVTGPMQQEAAPMHLDLGLNLCTVAGLMNLVVMVDAFTVAERTAFPVAKPAELRS
ncbi:MAG: DUF6677 family protein [Planctomycetota bacterium]